MIPEARLRAVVHGRVQRVGFRYYAVQLGRRLDLTGWVANRWDGAVETVAEGGHASLLQYSAHLNRGSPSSFVDHVDLIWSDPPTGEFDSFAIRYL